MPEGPECKITAEYLNKLLKGKKILDWVFSGGKYTEINPIGFEDFDEALPLKVEQVYSKGKIIVFRLQNEKNQSYYIIHTLMSSSSWQLEYDKNSKWFLEIEDGKTLWFKDSRGYSTLFFTDDIEEVGEKLDSLGPDILSVEFTLTFFKEMIQKYKNRNITSFLMDQEVLSGCGNYIKSEALYYAGVSPLRKVCDLTDRENELIYEGIIVTSRLSYNYNGLETKNFSNGCEKRGYYKEKLQIYGKKGSKKTKTPDGRITYWDPKKQK